ncbi:MAG: 2-oxoglutarate dehydrogenase complex dihydrolipoyllysine-residue succinyltransferase [Casimicrobiaceae bacterium]
MLVEVKVPQLSESVSEATLVSWHKKEGEFVARDENLIDIETDKVVLETPAPDAGQIKSIKKPNGASVTSNELIAVIDTDAKPAAGATKGTAAATPALATPTPATVVATPAAAAPTPASDAAASAAAASFGAPAQAMPAARKMMADAGMDPASVDGTGRGGRITKGDVIGAVEGRAPVTPGAAPALPAAAPAARGPAPSVPALGGALAERPEQRVPMSRLRQRVAERLVQSQSTAAILTTFNEVNMQPVIDLRNRYKERFEKEHGVKLGFMSFFVKAAVQALKKFPVVNASIDGSDIVYHGYFDIGIAVGSPRGLVVPILRDADQKSVAEIEKEIADFGQRAGEGKLGIEELTGGTFSISNGGVFGSMLSTPIINPPQSAILGVHATKERAVVENGQVVVRPINYLALSYDHRIIDGREAVLALVAIKDALEDPARILLDL